MAGAGLPGVVGGLDFSAGEFLSVPGDSDLITPPAFAGTGVSIFSSLTFFRQSPIPNIVRMKRAISITRASRAVNARGREVRGIERGGRIILESVGAGKEEIWSGSLPWGAQSA